MTNAIYQNDYNTLERLLPEVNINEVDAHGRTALMYAILAERPDISIVELLIKAGASVDLVDKNQKWTPLHFAARDRNLPIVSLLLQHGAKVDPTDVFGNTPLWRSVANSSSDLSILTILLRFGANPAQKNNSEVSPLDLAESLGKTAIVKLLSATRPEIA